MALGADEALPMTLAFKARVNDEAIASYRYRVLAPIAFLSARGHAVELYGEGNVERYDTVVFSKAYAEKDRKLARQLKAAGKRVLLDLCDDHFYNPADLPKYREAREHLLAMIALCDDVVCSTPVLARAVQHQARLTRPPAVAPDVYEQAEAPAGPPTPMDRAARLLWFGRHGSPNAPAGMTDMLLVREPLARAFKLRPFEVVICSDSRERYEELFAGYPVPTRFQPWSRESFAAELAAADAVLIPLSDNPFVAAKTHNRLSLALSAGVPVVADRLDSYEPFAPYAYLGDWTDGLEAVLLRPHQARDRAAAARVYLEAAWSAAALAPAWEAALGLPAGGRVGRIAADPLRPVTHVLHWLASHGRLRRPWLLAGEDAETSAVAEARELGSLVMALGAAIETVQADVALMIDTEAIAAHAAAIEANAGALLVPGDLHAEGWASGRSLASWGADLAALRRMRELGRLVRFDLWTGSASGLQADLELEDIARRLLASAGAGEARSLGVRPRAAASTGFDQLSSILERRRGRPLKSAPT
jgi:hypothetical protein